MFLISGGFFNCQLHMLLKYTCALTRLGKLCIFLYYLILGCSVEILNKNRSKIKLIQETAFSIIFTRQSWKAALLLSAVSTCSVCHLLS